MKRLYGFHVMNKNMKNSGRKLLPVIGVPIDSLNWPDALGRIKNWANAHESKAVYICNVHSVVTARNDSNFFEVINNSDLATPDGAPIAWVMRSMGSKSQERISGPDLMLKYCAEAAKNCESIYLYGGKPEVLKKLKEDLPLWFPGLKVAGSYSPPFREISEEEDVKITNEINASGAETVWVSLGCPKQEFWIADHLGKVNAVMIGVGAAFDYHAGYIKRAPLWMQKSGLEWFYRLCCEPRRLWKRYLTTNSLFFYYLVIQMLRFKP